MITGSMASRTATPESSAQDSAAPASSASSPRVLVVDDDPAVCGLLVPLLEDEGCHVTAVHDGHAALAAVDRDLFDLLLLDCQLPGVSGLDVLVAARPRQPDAAILMITGHGSVDSAITAMKRGADDYLGKPFDIDALVTTVQRALRDVRARRAHVAEGDPLRRRLLGQAGVMERLFTLVHRVAPTSATVLITGETGTGKELVARALHDLSPRRRGPFVAINCAALPETLLESELFGHRKGSFTGALADRRGLVEEAHGGTLFLDEIPTISPALQAKLLRVLQERQVQRVGGGAPVPVDFRLIAAGNVPLETEVRAGRFREDLYYRLNVFPLRVPPLRERREDIPLLVNAFRLRFAREHGIDAPPVATETMQRLVTHDWPGNVRELEAAIERAVIMHAGRPTLEVELPRRTCHADGATEPHAPLLDDALREAWSLDRLERAYIDAVLARTNGHRGRAAAILGIDRRTLYRKLRDQAA